MRVFLFLLLVFFFSLFGANCQSQDIKHSSNDTAALHLTALYPIDYNGVLKTNPLTSLWGSIPFTAEYMALYEFITSPQQSSQIGISYLSKSPVLKMLEDSVSEIEMMVFAGIRGQISHRFYLLKSNFYAPRGLYLSPHISYATVKVSTKYLQSRDAYWRITHFNMNLLLGWQWVKTNNFVFDVFMGMGYKENTWEEHQWQTTTTMNTDDIGNWYNRNSKFSVGFYFGIAI